eukprot:CAMPEP_0198143398 /NCGR_PEP_ID=MMETSP1443-20131203/7153_1 /TAXON_ID=186043 /ORGANISM="Entomoneis sp., Strain CCMP2396" /LENGTH=190 /DNA_ID=CAMNT_0043806631 /DNA_START=99 /DNA_END=671 /DNA_ORIENTATION=-
MEFIVNTLGFELPVTTARRCVMSMKCKHRMAETEVGTCCESQIRSMVLELPLLPGFANDRNKSIIIESEEDDMTLETVTSDEDDTSFSSTGAVTFANQVVTEVFYRPKLTLSEKEALFYSEADYQTFREDFFRRRTQRRRKVKFSRELVTDVFVYKSSPEKEALYYSESDLQRFLDEFVASLNGVAAPPS